jgi:hypothetical protein
MRTALCLLIPTLALAQGATPAKRPTVGAKPIVQVILGEQEGPTAYCSVPSRRF